MSTKKKQIRAAFRDAVFSRDNNRCRVCGASDVELDAHHIVDRTEMPNGGYVKQNGISLCESCHIKAEVYHSSNHTKCEEGFHPRDLYELINSSHMRAYKASENL